MEEPTPIQADFVNVKTTRRGYAQLIFEVPETAANTAIANLGGFPVMGESRICAIVLLQE
jgi:hypothetical protein